MSGFDFTLHQKPIFDSKTSYIQLQVGKGKKQQPSIYIDSEAFDCIRGVIWNKHREFGNQKKINQINNDDWCRILKGFEEAIVNLKACTDADQLIDVLAIRNQFASQKESIFAHKEALQQFIRTLIQWIEMHLKKEKYILIIQNDL
ncbi:MAG: hypothetical protein EA374_03340 [Acholeplasmatales bacterium]|nr:MAG: hypothetical protein EA374_03340 [Acholeplasmatales bacterium]